MSELQQELKELKIKLAEIQKQIEKLERQQNRERQDYIDTVARDMWSASYKGNAYSTQAFNPGDY